MKQTRHILLIFFSYNTPKGTGGLRSWHIGTHLANAGFRVTAIIPGVDVITEKRRVPLKKKMWYREQIDGVEVIWVNSTNNNRKSKISRALYYLSSSFLQIVASIFVTKVDLVVTAAMPITSVLLSFLQAFLRKTPFVIDVRDLSTDVAIELNYLQPNWTVKNILKLETWLFKHATCLVTVSEGWKERLIEKKIPSNKIVVIPIGFDGKKVYEGFTDWKRDIREEYNLSDKFIVTYAGTIGNVFDISVIVQAAKLTVNDRNIVYILIGSGQMLDYYRKYSKDNKLNCIFLGGKPKSDVLLFCSQTDICICSFKNGKFVSSLLGNKIFDYLGNGKITIYSGPTGDTSRLIEKSKGGVCVSSGDYHGIVRNIEYFRNNPKEIRKAGKRAEEYINTHYTITLMMDKFVATVSSLLQ